MSLLPLAVTVAATVACPSSLEGDRWGRDQVCFGGPVLILVDRGMGMSRPEPEASEEWGPFMARMQLELERRRVPVHVGPPAVFMIVDVKGHMEVSSRLRPESRGLLLLRKDALPSRFETPPDLDEFLRKVDEVFPRPGSPP